MRTLFSILILTLLSLSCASRPAGRAFPPGTVSHLVICYLKHPGDPAERQRLIEASRDLRDIPGVISIEAGNVLPSTRPVVVSDYDVAMVITFTNTDAMNAYITHPIHQKALKEVLAPLTVKVVIYDFLNE